MTGQQWTVVADREKGDDMEAAISALEDGDRVTYIYDTDPPDRIVRIERQVPTTEDPGKQFTPSTEQVRSHYVFDQSDRWDSERGAAFDRWLASVASPHPPTREQVAEVLYRDDQHEDHLWSEEKNPLTQEAYLKNADAIVAYLIGAAR